MVRVAQLPYDELAAHLARGQLTLRLTPYTVRLQSDIPGLARDLARLYEAFEVGDGESFADFHVAVSHERGLGHWLKPQARFAFDGRPSFVPLPAYQAFPMLEWGLNWCVAAHSHEYLVIHAAVVEHSGVTVLLPAPPGSGKSTLCGALICRGWRLLSDELALYDMDSGLLYGMARPLNLKNDAIDILRSYAPEAVMTAPVPNTSKGTVALMRPPAASVLRAGEAAKPAWIVLPQYRPGAAASLERYSRAETVMRIAEQSFNYHVHGSRGFDGVIRLVDRCECRRFTYSRLDDAVQAFASLLPGAPS